MFVLRDRGWIIIIFIITLIRFARKRIIFRRRGVASLLRSFVALLYCHIFPFRCVYKHRLLYGSVAYINIMEGCRVGREKSLLRCFFFFWCAFFFVARKKKITVSNIHIWRCDKLISSLIENMIRNLFLFCSWLRCFNNCSSLLFLTTI